MMAATFPHPAMMTTVPAVMTAGHRHAGIAVLRQHAG